MSWHRTQACFQMNWSHLSLQCTLVGIFTWIGKRDWNFLVRMLNKQGPIGVWASARSLRHRKNTGKYWSKYMCPVKAETVPAARRLSPWQQVQGSCKPWRPTSAVAAGHLALVSHPSYIWSCWGEPSISGQDGVAGMPKGGRASPLRCLRWESKAVCEKPQWFTVAGGMGSPSFINPH